MNLLPRWFLIGALSTLVAGAGCAPVLVQRRPKLELPDRYTIVRDQLIIYADFQVPARHRLLDELTARRADLRRQLAFASSDEPIHVYLFQDADRFQQYVRSEHPEFPDRRAFFVETDTRLEVYAQWGGHVGEDLRHEVTHAYLHAVLPNIPLWLDEGLAEYFEVPRGRHGLNREHLESLVNGGLAPDLARLEALDPETHLNQAQYAECWAWTHFLLESGDPTRDLLREYLYRLDHDGSTVPLSSRMTWRLNATAAQLNAQLADHLLRTANAAGLTRASTAPAPDIQTLAPPVSSASLGIATGISSPGSGHRSVPSGRR